MLLFEFEAVAVVHIDANVFLICEHGPNRTICPRAAKISFNTSIILA